MRERVHRIWFPGLLAVVTTYLGQTIIFQFEPPKIVHLGETLLVISYPWLVLLVGCGLLSSWFCYYEGGSPGERLLVSQFPVLLMLGTLLLAFGVSPLVDPSVSFKVKLTAMSGYLVGSVLLPCTALLIGATLMIAREQLGREPEEAKA
jgi:hypothetical protein